MFGKGRAFSVGCGWAAAMLNLYVQMGGTDPTNTAVVIFMLQSVLSSYTFNFSEQIPDIHLDLMKIISCDRPGLW